MIYLINYICVEYDMHVNMYTMMLKM